MNRLTLRSRRWLILTAVLLLAALARFPALDRVPPGWRDDELIEIGMDTRIQQGWRPLYIREAEGHEPLYHYLHAGTLALFGHNTYGYRWLPAAFGALSTALLVALAWRLFGFGAAALTGALYGVGLWPVLYSRFGVRHIGVMPFVLLALYALIQISAVFRQPLKPDRAKMRHLKFGLLAGAAMGLGLYIYYAAWVMPALVVAFGAYLLVFDRARFRQSWLALMLALTVALAIYVPMGLDLALKPTETRIAVTGAPLHALLEGDPRPILETTRGTLGMFTFAGDPEWLYNFSRRPVFDWITGVSFYLGVLICLFRWRDVRYGFVLLWFLVGISPAFISVPPASFSHTIAAQGVVYLLPALGLIELSNLKFPISHLKTRFPHLRFRVRSVAIGYLIFAVLVAWNVRYTWHYYFDWWRNHAMVRFDYHAETHELARWLDAQPEGGDIAISTTSNEFILEPLALSFDLKRKDIRPRWFDAEWALVFPNGGNGRIALLSFPQPSPLLEPSLQGEFVQRSNPDTGQLTFRVYRNPVAPSTHALIPGDAPNLGNLTLIGADIPVIPPHRGGDGFLLTSWRVQGPLADPLKLFAHLLDANGQMLGGDDRLNVLASSLRPGDVFIQINRLPRPADAACVPCRIEVGLYNPDTGERLRTLTGDRLLLPIEVTP